MSQLYNNIDDVIRIILIHHILITTSLSHQVHFNINDVNMNGINIPPLDYYISMTSTPY